MKHTQETLKALNLTGQGITGSGGSNIFQQANNVISNLKDLIKLAYQLRGDQGPGPDQGPPPGPPPRNVRELPAGSDKPPPPPDPQKLAASMAVIILDVAIANGLGEKTVKEVLELAGPFKLKDLRGYLK